jgi:hypothetical protein
MGINMEKPFKIVDAKIVYLTDDEVTQRQAEELAFANDYDLYKKQITDQVNNMLNNKAVEYGYYSMDNAATFAVMDNQWYTEAQALVAWQNTVWELTYAHFATQTKTENFINTLPAFEL